MNYFSYFSEIEDTFIRRRGKHLLLSPIDWALIETWQERGVPLHIALRGIEHAFDSHEAKKHKRSVKTLLYCQEEVEAQYAEWLESRVGSHDEAGRAKLADDSSPFPRRAVLTYVQRSCNVLTELYGQRRSHLQDELTEVLARTIKLLNEVKRDFESAVRPDTRKLEASLTGIERMLDDAMRAATCDQEMENARRQIDEQLKPYKRHMDKAAYKQTWDNLLRKKLREHFGVPRLSLFFIHS